MFKMGALQAQTPRPCEPSIPSFPPVLYLIATESDHEFFQAESGIRDIRRTPTQCFGYSIGCYFGRGEKWHVSVRIERSLFFELKNEFLAAAIKEDEDEIARRFRICRLSPMPQLGGRC